MAKDKTNDDVIKRLEAEAKAKKEAAKKEKSDAPEPEDTAKNAETENGLGGDVSAQLKEKADAEAARIMDSDEGANKEPEPESEPEPASVLGVAENKASVAPEPIAAGPRVTPGPVDKKYQRARAAAEKLKTIALSYPLTTPNEHPVFGRGGRVFTLGDLRDLVNIER